MKNINKLINSVFVIIIASSLISCSLDEDPKFTSNTKTIFSEKSAAKTSLDECYGHFATEQLYGQFLNEITIANGIYWAKSLGTWEERIGYNYKQQDGALSNVWKGFYKVIAESNYLIDGITKSNLDDDYKNSVVAQAHFLRGLAYFKLANLFGKAIVINEPITVNNLKSPLSSRDNVYAQAIKDLSYAAENIKEESDEKIMAGYATKGSAEAFLAKCYWMMACHLQSNNQDAMELFGKAKMYGDKVINSGKYSLEPNYANLFQSHVGDSPESIFQINFTIENGVRNRSSHNFSPNSYSINKGNSWGNVKMDRAFYDYYKGKNPDDPRIESIFLTSWTNSKNQKTVYSYPFFNYVDEQKEEHLYDMNTAPILNDDRSNPNYNFEAMPQEIQDKWTSEKLWDKGYHPYNKKMADAHQSASQFDTKNMIIFRYADLLLLMADVENELGNQGKAIEYVNQVLTRARNSGTGTTYPMNILGGISKEDLRNKIFFERIFEMAGETEMFEDIRRRGVEYLKKVMEIHNNNHLVKYRYNFEVQNEIKGPFREYIINKGDLNDETFIKKNLLLPIPSSEINFNDKVSQADQNFGY